MLKKMTIAISKIGYTVILDQKKKIKYFVILDQNGMLCPDTSTEH